MVLNSRFPLSSCWGSMGMTKEWKWIAILIGQIKLTFTALSDACTGDGVYKKYEMSNATLGAFSAFFMQSPSFLEYQKMMEKDRGKSNANSLFGVHLIPSTNQIKNLLDPVPAETLAPFYREIFNGLQTSGKIKTFQVLNNTTVSRYLWR